MDDNISYFQLIVETITTFFVLLLMTRILGQKQLSHLTFFNYITGITIGSLAANMVMLSTKDFLKELVVARSLVFSFNAYSLYRSKIRKSESDS